MTAQTLLAVALLAFMPTAQACINSVGTDHDGKRFSPHSNVGKDLVSGMKRSGARSYWLREAPALIAKASNQPDFKNLTDLGIVLIYQGQYALAVRHFLVVERRFPGRHETAANLGTALELTGHDPTALRWIRIGIQRNADEHVRSEWLHARILEAKIALAKDPKYLQGRSVAGVAFDKALVPAVPTRMPRGNDGRPVEPWELNLSLNYQLRERTGLVKSPDPIVANLLLDWATLNLAGGPVETADALYDFAVTYGAKRDALMGNRQTYIKRLLAQSANKASGGPVCGICQPM